MSNNPKSPYYNDFDGALNALSQAKLSQELVLLKKKENQLRKL